MGEISQILKHCNGLHMERTQQLMLHLQRTRVGDGGMEGGKEKWKRSEGGRRYSELNEERDFEGAIHGGRVSIWIKHRQLPLTLWFCVIKPKIGRKKREGEGEREEGREGGK